MKVITYQNNDAPVAFRAIAIIIANSGDLLPVMFKGANVQTVETMANEFYAREKARLAILKGNETAEAPRVTYSGKIDGRTKAGREMLRKQKESN